MTQLDHCVLANEILGPVLSGRSVHFKMASNSEEMRVLSAGVPTRTWKAYVYVYDYAYAYDSYVASGN